MAAVLKSIHIMGVLNVTPDSFSDGGRFTALDAALAQADRMVAEGATILDVGGESTRPGAEAVGLAEEKQRVLPVLEALRTRHPGILLSIDTYKAEVAATALAAGATIVNDISAGEDPAMAGVCAGSGATVLLMHRQGDSRVMQNNPEYPRGVVREVKEMLSARAAVFAAAGTPREKIWIDPGIGFGKTLAHNLELLRELGQFGEIAGRLAIGTSRKSFLAKLLGNPQTPMEEREAGTLASNLWAYSQGATVFRVHDVGAMVRGLKTWEAIVDSQS